MLITPERFHQYYEPGPPAHIDVYDEHWTGERYNRMLGTLGVSEPAVTDAAVDTFLFSYWQESRYFHAPPHPAYVSYSRLPRPLRGMLEGTRYEDPEVAKAIIGFLGDAHDVVYLQVDADSEGNNAVHPDVLELIDGMVDFSHEMVDDQRIHSVSMNQKGWADPFIRMAAHIFGVSPGGRLTHKEGANEFASAIAAIEFHKKFSMQNKEQPMSPIDLIAIAAGIACTIPFRDNFGFNEATGQKTNGFVEQIGRRTQAMLVKFGVDERYAWKLTNAIMSMGVHAANRDTGPFSEYNNFGNLANGAREVKFEEAAVNGVHVLRKPAIAMDGLAWAAQIMHWAPGLYNKMLTGEIPPDNAPKIFIPFNDDGTLRGIGTAYPSEVAYYQARINTRKNVGLAAKFFALHEVGIVFAASMATLVGEPKAEVPGFVNSMLRRRTMRCEGPQLRGNGLALYNELNEGKHQRQVGTLTPQESPIAASILSGAGLAQALQLSNIIQRDRGQTLGNVHPYSVKSLANNFRNETVARIGPANYNVILGMLIRAAKYQRNQSRVEALQRQLAAA